MAAGFERKVQAFDRWHSAVRTDRTWALFGCHKRENQGWHTDLTLIMQWFLMLLN